jgi:predicted acyl esterase
VITVTKHAKQLIPNHKSDLESEEPLAGSHSREKMPINDDGVRVEIDVPITMRDGVRLFADV